MEFGTSVTKRCLARATISWIYRGISHPQRSEVDLERSFMVGDAGAGCATVNGRRPKSEFMTRRYSSYVPLSRWFLQKEMANLGFDPANRSKRFLMRLAGRQ